MTDRELLELAAKAAGKKVSCVGDGRYGGNVVFYADNLYWNPLADNGDAFELLAKLRLDIDFEKLYMVSVWCPPWNEWVTEYSDDGMGTDIAEKTRRAIVRAAAEVGRNMK